MKTVNQEDIRAIHSRLDVHKEILCGFLDKIANSDPLLYCYFAGKLKESQNPFEVSDGKID